MNKKNKILVGCLALLLVLSVGYALFSETITINGTATAKGSFKFEAACSTTIPDVVLAEYNPDRPEGGFANATCTANGTTVTSSVDLLYPSSKKFFYSEFENTGSIAGMLKFDSYGDLSEDILTYEFALKLYNRETDELTQTITDNNTIFNQEYYPIALLDKIFIKKQDGTYLHTKEELLANNKVYTDTSGNMYVKIEPGETFVITYEMWWPNATEETDYYSTLEFKMGFDLIQETSDLQIQTENKAPQFCITYC